MGPTRLGKFVNMNTALNQETVDWRDVARHAADSKWARTQTPKRAREVIKGFGN